MDSNTIAQLTNNLSNVDYENILNNASKMNMNNFNISNFDFNTVLKYKKKRTKPAKIIWTPEQKIKLGKAVHSDCPICIEEMERVNNCWYKSIQKLNLLFILQNITFIFHHHIFITP